MAQGRPVPSPVYQRPVQAARDSVFQTASRTREIGYRALLLLAFGLPFDMERRPLLWTSYLSVTNLTVLLLAVSALAIVTVTDVAIDARRGSPSAIRYFSQRRATIALLFAFLLSSAVSTILARSSTQALTWLLGILTGALLWLALPLWLADDTEAKVNRLGTAIVAGAVVASIVGLIEILIGSAFDQHLLLFKLGPSVMGPFLRLSSTFSSANVAAMYFELALPFAVAGLSRARIGTSQRWLIFAAWLAAVDLLLVALVFTYSRGAMLGVLAAGLAVAAAGRGAWRSRIAARWRGVVLVAANLALVFGLFALSSSSPEQLRFSTQNDQSWYRAAYASTVPRTITAGRSRTIPVTVRNRSPLTWHASSPHAYGLSYHWLYPSWKIERFTNNITWLSSDLLPGGQSLVEVKVKAPRARGKYLLIWDLIWMDTTWFGPKTGEYKAIPVTVIPPATRPGRTTSGGPDAPPDIAGLPTASTLDRGQIWAVAMTMIEKQPWFGVGPQGVRMNYLSFAPRHSSARVRTPPPHAHNVALETLADWGTIGGGLFFGLLAVLWWPLVQRVWIGDVKSGRELAVVGAAAALLGHEVVDYFLTKQGIFIIFWLLCGLAATMSGRASADHGRSPNPAPSLPG